MTADLHVTTGYAFAIVRAQIRATDNVSRVLNPYPKENDRARSRLAMMPGDAVEGSTYRTLFEWLPVPVLVVDAQLCIELANRAARELLRLPAPLGVSVASIIGEEKAWQRLRDAGGASPTTAEVRFALPGASALTILKVISAKFATSNPSRQRWRRSERSKARGLRVLVLEDVTDGVVAEDQVVQAEKLAGMGQLASGIAHEIANPLTSIVANLMYIRENIGNPERDAILQAIDATAERLADMHQLVSTLSGFVRHHQPRYEIVDLQDLIRRTAAFIAREAVNCNIQLSVLLEPAKLDCEMDARLMRHVLLNLIKNAIEAMPRGGRLGIRSIRVSKGPKHTHDAVIEISDTGVGIAENDMRKAFRPLYSTKPGGTGLGLPFCRQAVEEHGGEIRLSSQRGVGTTVTITLPLCQSLLCD